MEKRRDRNGTLMSESILKKFTVQPALRYTKQWRPSCRPVISVWEAEGDSDLSSSLCQSVFPAQGFIKVEAKGREMQGRCQCGTGESQWPVIVPYTLICPTGNSRLMAGTPGGIYIWQRVARPSQAFLWQKGAWVTRQRNATGKARDVRIESVKICVGTGAVSPLESSGNGNGVCVLMKAWVSPEFSLHRTAAVSNITWP